MLKGDKPMTQEEYDNFPGVNESIEEEMNEHIDTSIDKPKDEIMDKVKKFNMQHEVKYAVVQAISELTMTDKKRVDKKVGDITIVAYTISGQDTLRIDIRGL